MTSLKDKLLNVQCSFKAPKGQYNSHGKYNYRSCEDILEALKPALKEHGLGCYLSDKPVLIGDWHYIEAQCTVFDDEGEIEIQAYAREHLTGTMSKQGRPVNSCAQVTGSTSSYARKYALCAMFLLDDNKDDDATNKHEKDDYGKTQDKKPQPTAAVNILTPQKAKLIKDLNQACWSLINHRKFKKSEILKELEVNDPKEFNQLDENELIDMLNHLKDKFQA